MNIGVSSLAEHYPDSPTECVYLIGCADNSLVKIGRSGNLPRRLATLQYASPTKLTVLWQTEGGPSLEADLHRKFDGRRAHGEWFDFQEGDALDRVQEALAEILAEETGTAVLPREPRQVWIARVIRERIVCGSLAPGQMIPSEKSLMAKHGASRETVRKAIAALRAEGLVITEPQNGTYVSPVVNDPLQVYVTGDTTVRSRMPTPEERAEMGIHEGVPVFIVTRDGEEAEVHPADRTVLCGA